MEADWGACIQTLYGHSNLVSSVAFSHNGTQVVSGSYDETVKIWDVSSGACLKTLEGHSRIVNSVAFLHNSTQVVSGSDDETVKIWDASSGACLKTLESHSSTVTSVAFSHDGTQVVSGSGDNTVKIWDASSGDCLKTLEDHSYGVSSVAFSHDGTQVLSGSFDNTVKIWDASSGACLKTLEGHSYGVKSVAFSYDGTKVVSGSGDYTVKIWDASSGACRARLLSSCVRDMEPLMRPAFQYDRRLNKTAAPKTIRLIEILPGGASHQIRCRTRYVSLGVYENRRLELLYNQLKQLKPEDDDAYEELQQKKRRLTECRLQLRWLESRYRASPGGRDRKTFNFLLEELGNLSLNHTWNTYRACDLVDLSLIYDNDILEITRRRGLPSIGLEIERYDPDDVEETADTIQVELEHEAPSYAAISYTWGGQKASVEIECDQCSVLITENLAEALRSVRSGECSRLLWADALCINQADDDEKSYQISIMPQIYEHASCVEVYLGQDSHNSDATRAFRLLEELYQASQRLGQDSHDGDATRAFRLLEVVYNADPRVLRELMQNEMDLISSSLKLQELGIPPENNLVYQSLENLVARPWFSRAWVVQEIMVAQRASVHCGRLTIPWKVLKKGLLLAIAARRLPSTRVHRLQSLCSHRAQFYSRGFDIDLIDLLEAHRSVCATDPRDKVFAFFGISRKINGKEIPLQPNYSLTPQEVYASVTACALRMQNTLNVLSFPRFRDRAKSSITNLPSWAVDWTEPDDIGTPDDPCWNMTEFEAFDAADTRSVPKHCIVDGPTLELSGVILDEVSEVGELLESMLVLDRPRPELVSDAKSIYESQMEFVKSMCSVQCSWQVVSHCRVGKEYVNGEDSYDAFLRTILLDRLPLRTSIRTIRSFGHLMNLLHRCFRVFYYLHSILRWCFLWRPVSYVGRGLFSVLGEKIIRDEYGYLLGMWQTSVGRRLIRTRKGYVGMAGALTQKGDHIALVKGGRIPLILRRIGEKWIFIGDSYVHGIMQGEAFYEDRCEKIIVE